MNAQEKVAFYTLGCKLNFSETSTIARAFLEKGFQKVEFDEAADVYVINTCSVTENADKECRRLVRKARKTAADAKVIVVGCYAQLKPEEIASIEGVDLVLGASEKFKITEYIDKISKSSEPAQIFACEIGTVDFYVSSYSTGDRTRAFLKVQDGCDYSCAFCTIPLARGKSRSDSIENVLRNAHRLSEHGIKEIVLTGVNIGDFGKTNRAESKKHAETFYQLVQALDKVESIERFRISSIEPNLLEDRIIEYVASSEKFVPHFHIPLQSGSNKILKSMRRRYLRELYSDRVHKIKQLMPHCCIGADVITGFPGETHDDFLDTYNFLNELEVSYLHVFTYSERANTEAIKMERVVPLKERQERTAMLRILSEKKKNAFYTEHLNKAYSALFEEENHNGFMYGFTENYIKVKVPYNNSLINQTRPVTLQQCSDDGLMVAHLN